jgi:anti-sigma regulatory factor (Ser/Thr protein kinase)
VGHAAAKGVAATASVLLPHVPASVSVARRTLAVDLAARGVTRSAIDDAALVLSELMSNALKHARPLASGEVRVHWSVQGEHIAIDVTDGGSTTRPRPHPPSMSALGGRGLSIVGTLASEWGVQEEGEETTVWALVRPLAAHV